jgi:nanoRNase/pAp phosphatase (c-di-AMP/oligoRNAs hydrolase)
MSKNSYGMSLSMNPFDRKETGIDLSKLAEKYGGGGHPNAAGISAESKEKIYEIMQACGEEIELKLNEKK